MSEQGITGNSADFVGTQSMTYRQNGAASRFGRLATWLTGGRLQWGFAGPHMMIVVQSLLLVAGLAAMIAAMRGYGVFHLMYGLLMASTLYRLTVEFRERGYSPHDEREDAIRWKAMAIGAGAPGLVLVVWMMLLGAFADEGLWHPVREDDWVVVAMFAVGLAVQISAIAKAWMTPAYAAELLDEDG